MKKAKIYLKNKKELNEYLKKSRKNKEKPYFRRCEIFIQVGNNPL